MSFRKIPTRKHTAATVITVIELVAILGMYLTLGVNTGLQLMRGKGWLPEAPRFSVQADSTPKPTAEEPTALPEEEVLVVPEVTPEPAVCPGCGAVLSDPTAQFCSSCGADLWNFSAQQEPETTLEPLELELIDLAVISAKIDVGEVDELTVVDSWESSIVEQRGNHDNSAAAAVDGDTDTSWQEGVEGDGLNEYIVLDLGQETQVEYLMLWLGNWRSDDWYNRNNVPSVLHIQFYDDEWNYEDDILTFPKERHPFGVALSHPATTRYVCIEILEVYPGSQYDDTCIAEIRICGGER